MAVAVFARLVNESLYESRRFSRNSSSSLRCHDPGFYLPYLSGLLHGKAAVGRLGIGAYYEWLWPNDAAPWTTTAARRRVRIHQPYGLETIHDHELVDDPAVVLSRLLPRHAAVVPDSRSIIAVFMKPTSLQCWRVLRALLAPGGGDDDATRSLTHRPTLHLVSVFFSFLALRLSGSEII